MKKPIEIPKDTTSFEKTESSDYMTDKEILRQEMDQILLKTLTSVQPILDNQGEDAAREFIEHIALGIENQLNEDDSSALNIHKLFLHDLNAALFSTKH